MKKIFLPLCLVITGIIILLILILCCNGKEAVLAQSPTPTPSPVELPGAIDVTLSIDKANISTEERTPYEEILGYFADAIYEMSNGVHKVRQVTVYEDGEYADVADIVWREQEWPRAHVSGHGLSEYHVIMGDVFPFSSPFNALAPANWRCAGYTLGHEWGHYYYSLYDEYSIDTSSISGRLDNSSPYPNDIPVQNSVMNNHWVACEEGDLNWLNFSVAKYQTGRNAQHRVYGASGWETLARPLWEDPRRAARYAVRERTYFPELTTVAPIGNQDPSLELVSIDLQDEARSELAIIWASDALTETEQEITYHGVVESIYGQEIVYPQPVILVAQVIDVDPIAKMIVEAEVEYPDGHVESLHMVDDGKPPDVLGDDGLYSGFMPYAQGGTYEVSVTFNNTSNTAEFTQASYEHSPGPDGEMDFPDPVPVGKSFDIVATTQVTVIQVTTDDHGNTPMEATLLATNNIDLTGRIDYTGDVDVFKVVPQTSSALIIRVSNLAFGMQPSIRLFASDGETLLNEFRFEPQDDGYFFTRLKTNEGEAVYVEVSHLDETASEGVYDIGAGSALENDTESPNPTETPPPLSTESPGDIEQEPPDGGETDLGGSDGGVDLPELGPLSPLNLPFLRGLGFLESILAGLPVVLQWIAVILLILLLALLLWLFLNWLFNQNWGGKETKTSNEATKTENSIDFVGPKRGGNEVNAPDWIKRLTIERTLSQNISYTAEDELRDTVLIGLGPAGQEVLSQVSDVLEVQFGGDHPSNVRFLQVEVQPIDGGPTRQPPENWRRRGMEWVLLRPDLDSIESNLQQNPEMWQHWQWYDGARPTYDRARGRMGVFHDLRDGSSNSRLWRALERVLSNLDSPVVRVVGSTFDDTSSGMLVDIARLTQIVAGQGMDVELWLTGPVGRDWSERLDNRKRKLRASEQSARTLATLRELERFQHNTPVTFTYVPPRNPQSKLRQEYEHAVVQSLFIFEPVDDRAAPADDVLACMADSLLAMLYPEVVRAWNRHLSINGAKASGLINQEGLGMMHMMGSYTVRVPIKLLRQAIAWRMVRDVLFEATLGLISIDRYHQNGQYETLDVFDRKRVMRALNPHELREELNDFVKAYRTRLDSQDFASAVGVRVNDILNGERGQRQDTPALLRTDGLARATEWLESLSSTIGSRAPKVARQIDNLGEEARHWEAWLEDDVHPLCREKWLEVRRSLDRLLDQPARHWTLDEQLEWPLYHKEVKPWDDHPSGTMTNEPLLQLSGRFGWDVQCPADGQWHVHLITPPSNFVWKGRREAIRPFTLQLPDAQAGQFLESIYTLALPLARAAVGRTMVEHLSKSQDILAWSEQAEARIGEPYYNESAASAQIGTVNKLTVLVTPIIADLASSSEEDLKREGQFDICKTQNTTSITVIKASDWVPMNTHRLYDDDAWQNNIVLPSMYVWRPEQLAAEIEGEQRLSPNFVAWLVKNQELLRYFGLGLIYDVIHKSEQGWHVPGMSSQEKDSVCEVLDAAFETDHAQVIAALKPEVEKRRQETAQKRFSYMQQVEKKTVTWLEQSDDLRKRDLGHYLRGLISVERG